MQYDNKEIIHNGIRFWIQSLDINEFCHLLECQTAEWIEYQQSNRQYTRREKNKLTKYQSGNMNGLSCYICFDDSDRSDDLFKGQEKELQEFIESNHRPRPQNQ